MKMDKENCMNKCENLADALTYATKAIEKLQIAFMGYRGDEPCIVVAKAIRNKRKKRTKMRSRCSGISIRE